MDQAKELTARYICENEEWLKIALHVFEAKEAVRWHLTGKIWEGVRDKIHGIEDADITRHNGFWFRHVELWNLWIFAELEQGRGRTQYLTVGIYLADGTKLANTRREKIRQSYGREFGKQRKFKDQYLVKDRVGDDRGLDRWDQDVFLRQAIMSRDAIESYVANLLLEIYDRMEGDMKQIEKDEWG